MSALNSLLRYAALSIACVIIASNGLSALLAANDPAAALAVNPFNTDARIALVAGGLAPGGAADLAGLRANAETALRFSPGDARAYSALGGVLEREGDGEGAETLYRRALDHSKTELHALLSLLSRSAARADPVAALGYADLSLRRWPGYAGQVLPLLPAVLDDPAGRAELGRLLEGRPPWRQSAIDQLLKAPGGPAFVRDLILSEVARGKPASAIETAWTIRAMIAAGVPDQAYQFFVLTLGEDEGAVAGYVHDPDFSRPPRARYFGWTYQANSAADVAFPAPGGGLRIRFLDSPARMGNIAQTLALPPGPYDMEMVATASGLRIPRGLYWNLRCASGGARLARLDVAPDSYERAGRVVSLDVPAMGCPLQVLTLATDVRTDSWRDRYVGLVTFETLRIVRKEAAYTP